VKITCIHFSAIFPHEGRNAMYSSSTKVEYTTDVTLGGMVRLKCYLVQHKKGAKCFNLLELPEASRSGWN
jgi:hypothetical protein